METAGEAGTERSRERDAIALELTRIVLAVAAIGGVVAASFWVLRRSRWLS